LTSLADRIRGIVNGTGPTGPAGPKATAADVRVPEESRDLAPLGGEWRDGCYVIEREWQASARHGRERVGVLGELLGAASGEAPFFAAGAPARPPFVFVDLETTGLSGGAGTHAFLVGCGWFDADGFMTRQFIMTRYADERPMLDAVARECARAGALVSFNGKSFDAPVLESRYLFHRLDWFGRTLPHLDVLHPARQFWKQDDCSLLALERQLVGHRRVGDVPGFQVPARYFHFVKTGDVRPLCAVLEHNRLDLLSLAALTTKLLHLAQAGADGVRDAREALALGLVYARAGLESRARAAFIKSLALCRSPRGAFDATRIDALRGLAIAWRRVRQFDDAANCWKALLEIRGCPAHIACEATEALAIHHEHRLRDLPAARALAVQNLETVENGTRAWGKTWSQAVRHRLARLDRKLERSSAPPQSPFLPLQPASAAPPSALRTSS
jgi:uncharacterized protein YprB with RNaseH-like and TPR domain